MNRRLVSVLLFALVISGGASFLLYRLISAQIAANAKNREESAQLVVASRTLEIGALIKDGDVKLAPWSGTIPPGAVMKTEDAIGRGVVQLVVEGEAILETRLAQRGAGAGLAAIIPPGKRAVAVRVNEVVGVAGFVTPGMHVDVLIAGNPPGQSTVGTQARTILQNIEVLSAGQNLQKNAEGKPENVQVVNLLVTPEQAEVLSLASNETRIQLVLRNPMDKEVSKTPGTAVANLFGAPARPVPTVSAVQGVRRQTPAAPPPPPVPVAVQAPPPPITVEVIHGTKKTESKFSTESGQAATASEARQ
jgi:pilus assembly protein CpaB